ncbi:alpha,alpha-trehalose-phosphate synthase (UDP-forming) [Parapedomonas caeni]|jgi:trehalose 6-phosphate synthase
MMTSNNDDRLVIVSNRVPTLGRRGVAAAGGLAVAIKDALVPGRTLWFGWSGRYGPEAGHVRHARAEGIDLVTLDLTEAAYRAYYVAFANRTLWPLLHYRQGLLTYDRQDFATYLAVNGSFAEHLMPQLRAGDRVWVHDYHLMPMGQRLRQRGFEGPIGFFLHIPFVPPAMFSALPAAPTLLRAMMAYDHVGFQTEEDRQHFLDCLRDILGARITADGCALLDGRMTRTSAIPAGIDPDEFQQLAEQADGLVEVPRLRDSIGDKALIVGVDRLDYSKGLPHRFRGFGRMLESHPEHRGRVSFLQVAPRSRDDVAEYRDLKRELDRLAGQINGQYADLDWVPLRYLTRPVPRPVLAGVYRTARVGLVTPLRDGMNLVAKEFVAAQDPADPGVLILSRFAGAAGALGDALLINPHDPDEIAEALDVALTMPLAERQARNRSLREAVWAGTASAWSQAALAALTVRPAADALVA